MRLLRSELLRARSRRIVPMVVVAGVLAIVVGLGIAAGFSSPPSQTQLSQAQADYDRQLGRCMKGQYLGSGGLPSGYDTLEQFCRDNSAPYIEDAGIQLRDLSEIISGISTFVILLGALLGASLGGADWTSDTMTTLLTWEPRRIRVLLARAVVVVAFALAITVALQAVFAGVFWLGATSRGTTAFTPSGLWTDVAQTLLRTSVVATAFAAVCLALAMIGRSTVAALGVLFGYLILFEGVIAGFRPSIQGWLLIRAGIVVVSQDPILDYSTRSYSGSSYTDPTVLMSVARAPVVVGVYVVALLGIALVVFRRRDIS